MTSELQQVLIIILGLITVVTLDAFRKALENSPSSFINEFKQIVIQEGASYAGNIDKRVIVENGNYVVDGAINYGGFEKRQTLAEAAIEIQELLQQLEKSNPTATEAEKGAYVNDEAEPDLKSRVIKALKSGGETAIESLDSHYINIIKAVIEGWQSSR